MTIYTENTVSIDEVIKDIFSILGYELKECKKVEFEIRSNRVYKEMLEEICLEIWLQANSNTSPDNIKTEIFYTSKFDKNMCEYRIKLIGLKTIPEYLKKIKKPFYFY